MDHSTPPELALVTLTTKLAGFVQAEQVILDVMLHALVERDPAIAASMQRHLDARYDEVPGELRGEALKAFEARVKNFRSLLALYRIQRP